MYDHAQVTKDAPKDVVIAFDNNSITLQKIDPYGFLKLSLAQGTLPERFQGLYTSIDLAQHAAEEYIEQYKEAKAEIKKKVNGSTESNRSRK